MEIFLSSATWVMIVFLLFLTTIILSILFRRVVSTNMVHIVQSSRQTSPYGTGNETGNVYYKWPRWLPYLGVTVIELPVSNFDLSLKDYEAYDKDRVPFKVDVTAFFRIENTALAAQRVSSMEELRDQLMLIVQGAVRKVLASDVIDSIMLERAKFGEQFTSEVREQLKEWGTESVKSMELMDIRDGHDSQVISNIMAKNTSHIEMESRREVATNMKTAETAEIEARQAVDIRKQEAEQDKQTRIIKADGMLGAKRKEATGIELEGIARGEAEKAMKLAPVSAQIALAKEIGANPGYQQYLAMIEAIGGYVQVGSKQAEALKEADVKVIANTGKPTEGLSNAMGLFTSKGGTELGSMIEAFAQTPLGKIALAKLGVVESTPPGAPAATSSVDPSESPKPGPAT